MEIFLNLSSELLTRINQNDNIATSFGDLAQLVEHTAHIRDVNGSIPLVAIVNPNTKVFGFFFVLK